MITNDKPRTAEQGGGGVGAGGALGPPSFCEDDILFCFSMKYVFLVLNDPSPIMELSISIFQSGRDHRQSLFVQTFLLPHPHNPLSVSASDDAPAQN